MSASSFDRRRHDSRARRASLPLLLLLGGFLAAGCGGESGNEVTEPPEPTFGDMVGTVTDLFGSPLDGATVTATPSGGFPVSQTTDASGVFAFSGLATGPYTVTAEQNGFEEASVSANVPANSAATVNLQLDPLSLPSSGTLASRVLGTSGSNMTFEVDVYVVDAGGQALSGLGPTSFSIGDFTGFSFSQQSVSQSTSGAMGPYSAALLLDQSGSIRTTDPNDARVQAAKIFLSAVSGGDYAIVSAFSSGGSLPFEPVTTWGSFTSNGSSFYSVVDQLPSMESGGTPLYQAAASMVDYTATNAPTSNQAVIIFTDGEDTRGGWSIDQVIDLANQRGVRLYTVGLSSSVDVVVLSRLANETGGSVMWASDAQQLVSMYKTLGGVLRGAVTFYRTRWTATLTNGQNWGSGGWLQSGVSIQTSAGVVWAPFYVSIP